MYDCDDDDHYVKYLNSLERESASCLGREESLPPPTEHLTAAALVPGTRIASTTKFQRPLGTDFCLLIIRINTIIMIEIIQMISARTFVPLDTGRTVSREDSRGKNGLAGDLPRDKRSRETTPAG